jgi:hypothetical protein
MPKYERASSLFARRVAGELLLVPVDVKSARQENRAADLFVLNATGEFLWNLLQRAHSEEELASALAAEFEVDVEQARRDVDSFLHELRAIGALKQAED